MNRALLVLLLFLQDKPKHPWLGFKEGSWISVRETSQPSGGKETRVEKKTTIVKVEGKNVSVREETTTDGQKGPAMERTMVADDKEKTPPGEKEDLPKEKVKVGTRTFECAVVEYVSEMGSSKITTRIWTAKEAPGGGLVKKMVRVVDTASGASTTTTQLSKTDETVKVGSKSARGWVIEVLEESSTLKTTTKLWYSEQVPGWLVKRETRTEPMTGPGAASISRFEILDFESKK